MADSGRCLPALDCSCLNLSWLVGSGPAVEKSKSSLRWVILVFACLMLIGSYYCYDIPAALKTQIDDYMGDPAEYETYFGLFYTLYSVPNVILPFFAGFFVDKIGVRMSMLIFASLVGAGQLIFSFGLSIESWPVMFLGRFVFGLGGENLVVANSALLADWFKGQELAFAFGINLSIARLGSVFNNLLSPALTDSLGLVFACWFGALLCGASILCVLCTIPIDKAFDMKLEKLRKPLLENMEQVSDTSLNPVSNDKHNTMISVDESREASSDNPLWKTASFTSHPHETSSVTMNDEPLSCYQGWMVSIRQFLKETISLPHIFWVLVILCVVVYGCVLPFNNIESSLLLERNYFKAPPNGCALTYTGKCQSDLNPPNSACPSSKWYQPPLPYDITLSDGTIYPGQVEYADVDCTEDVWADECTVEFCNRLSTGESQAAVIMSIPYIISAVMSPVLGFAIDKFGLRAVIASIAPMLIVIVHSLLGFTKVNPVGPLVGQGLAYTGFAAVLWPAVPLVIVEELTGLAFGIVTSALNLATAVIPLIVASIYMDSNEEYIPNVELLFVGLGAAGVVVGLYLNYYDIYHDHVLNRGEISFRKDYQPITSDSKDENAIFPATPPKSISHVSDDLISPMHGHHAHRITSTDSEDPNHYHRHPKGSFTAYEEVHRSGGI
jgi:MFS family permease